MPLPSEKWELIPLETVPASHLEEVWRSARGKKYDWTGAIGTVLKIRQSENKWFCSEFCAAVMGIDDGWRFSPNDLAALAKSGRFDRPCDGYRENSCPGLDEKVGQENG